MMRQWLSMSVVAIILLFCGVSGIEASDDRLETLHIHMFIEEDGSATITERRVAYITEGTENFIVIGNLGRSSITNFTVWEDGKAYDYVDDWDIHASREEKTFKNGIIETGDGYELIWGIGEYGHHEYIIQYIVTDMIKQLQDSQMLFWRFVNDQLNMPPQEVIVHIESADELSEEQENIWAFGFPGWINFQDGGVVAYNSEPLGKQHYVTILIQFEDGLFATNDVLDQTFEQIKERAFEGSHYGEESTEESRLPSYVRNTLIALLIGYVIFRRFKPPRRFTVQRPRKLRRRYRGEYYRNDPYDGHYLHLYHVLYNMGASHFERLLTGLILKWIHEDRITVDTELVGIVKKSEAAVIHFVNKEVDFQSELEHELFQMMLEAAGSNHKLEQHEFTSWARTNYEKLVDWEKRVTKESIKQLESEDYIEKQQVKRLFSVKDKYVLTQAGKELEAQIYKYMNYLHDFSLLHEHEPINVKIWDQIMIWAAFLGLTDVVSKQFRTLYPAYEQQSIYSDHIIHSTTTFTRSATDASSPSSGSGGGGASSIGGGGGSFGGGSGGGTR